MKIIERTFGGEQIITWWCPGCDTTMSVCPKRWNWNGDKDKPTLSPSILQTVGPFPDGHKEICHCFVRDGNIEFCGDCTHSLAGKTMPLPHFDDVVNLVVEPDGRVWWTRKESNEQP